MTTTQAAPAAPKATHLSVPLSALVLSKTHVQARRRLRFTDENIAEIAESIKVVGVLESIVTRPTAGGKQYEIIAGERRYLGAKRAGLAEAPISVREMTDDQVIEAQLIENLQREGLDPLDEAEGYRELMKLKNLTADQVAARIGKSRSYVYGRTKLLDLGKTEIKLIAEGKIDPTVATKIARIPVATLRSEAAKEIADNPQFTFKRAVEFLQQNYTVELVLDAHAGRERNRAA